MLRHGYAWNAEPDRLLAFLVEFLRDDMGCQVGSDAQREDGWCVQTTGASPLSKSSLGVLLAALTSIYETLIGAGYYAYRNPMHSERLVQLKQEHLRHVKNAGAPDNAGIRSETRAETNRTFPTTQFRQRRGKVWEPEVVLEPDEVQKRMRKTIDYMGQHAPFLRDQVILLLLRQTGARLSEVLEMTVGGYRAAHHAGRALVKNKGSRGREEKLIHFTESIEASLIKYVRTERAQYDPQGRKRLSDLDDRDPLFLTRTGKPYTRAAFYYNWKKLFEPAQQQFKPAEQVSFTPHDLRHLRVTRAVTKIRKDAKGDAAEEASLLEGFQELMGWRSRETMATYTKTMNKRQAIKAVLDDEEAVAQQEQSAIGSQAETLLAKRPLSYTATTHSSGITKGNLAPLDDQDELSWYEDDE